MSQGTRLSDSSRSTLVRKMREMGVAVNWLISLWSLEKGADRP